MRRIKVKNDKKIKPLYRGKEFNVLKEDTNTVTVDTGLGFKGCVLLSDVEEIWKTGWKEQIAKQTPMNWAEANKHMAKGGKVCRKSWLRYDHLYLKEGVLMCDAGMEYLPLCKKLFNTSGKWYKWEDVA